MSNNDPLEVGDGEGLGCVSVEAGSEDSRLILGLRVRCHSQDLQISLLGLSRSRAAAPNPSSTGIEMSIRIRSGRYFSAAATPSAPFSADEKDVSTAYDLHANAYICKPVDLEQFLRVVRSVEDFWFAIVRLPEGRQRP